DVAGLVLIDPPEQNVAAFAPAWAKDDVESSKQRFAFIRQCAKGAEQGLLAAPPDNLKRCISPVVPFADAKVTAAVVGYKMKPAYWHTLLSELQNNQIVFAQPVSANENHGSMPLVVLTADNTYADAPPAVRKLLEAARESTQAHIAATSTGGKRVFVKNTSHDIQIDQPQAVADAILAMISDRQMATQPKR
ncbi:MAG TPA: alpha/beta hydrolase, partial [Rudaea sp.]|nr:alpha/beta hydrolase [Rudaea sp.]